MNGTITRIATIVPGNNIIYNIFQNAGRSYNTGGEVLIQQQIAPWVSMNVSGIIYQNTLNAFSIQNQYPVPTIYNMPKESILSGNLKWNVQLKLVKKTDLQLSATYLAPDLIPQGRIGSRFSTDLGIKRQIQNGKGEFFLNGNDIFNTLKIRKDITGNGFRLISTDYNETQVFRIGYSYKF